MVRKSRAPSRERNEEHFTSILSECDVILNHFKDMVPAPTAQPWTIRPDFDLTHFQLKFEQALQYHRLSPALTNTLLRLYQSGLEGITKAAKDLLCGLKLAPSRHIGPADVLASVQSSLERKCERYQRLVLDMIIEARSRFELEAAEASWPADEDAPLERSQDGTPSKHPKWVVEALELVFAHSDNITRAEKNRLAEALELQPHQVTIWFQNRRGRGPPKTIESVEAPAPQSSPSTDPEPANAGGKRKRGFEDDGEREDRQQPFVHQQDSESRIQFPSLAQKRPRVLLRDFSGTTSSSGYTSSPESSFAELDAFPHGRISKIRHASTDSGCSSATSVGSVMQLYGGIHHIQMDDQKPDIHDGAKETSEADDGANGHDEIDEDDELDDEEDEDDDDLDEEDDELADDTPDTSFGSYQPDPSELLFHPDGTLQPDAEDLRIDLNELERSLLNDFKFNDFFQAPPSPTTALQRMTISTQQGSANEATPGVIASATPNTNTLDWLSPTLPPPSQQPTPGLGYSDWFSLSGNCEGSNISFSDNVPDFQNMVTQVSSASLNTPQLQTSPIPVSAPAHQPCTINTSSQAPAFASPGPVSLSDNIFDFEFGSFSSDFAYTFTAPATLATSTSETLSATNNNTTPAS